MTESKCVEPGAIEDWELEAYADGDAFPHVIEHLNRCPACREHLVETRSLEGHLRQTLYRLNCPSPDTLRDYYWGDLPAEQQRRVKDHVDWCPHCTAELAELKEFLSAEGAASSATLLNRAQQAADQVRLIVARLISPSQRPVLALRGEMKDVLLFDTGEGAALSLNLVQEDTGAHTLFGQVLSPPTPFSSADHVRLTGYQGTREQQEPTAPVQASLDANGSFAVPNLRSGSYQLVVCLSDRRIVVPTLTLTAES